LLWFSNFELFRIDLRVDLVPIERGFLDGVGAHGAAQPEGELQAVDVAVVGEIETVLDWRRRCGTACAGGRRTTFTSGSRGRCASLTGGWRNRRRHGGRTRCGRRAPA